MAKNKRGLSAVVITLIIILLSLVSIGILWVVVGKIIGGGTKEIETSGKCLNTKIEVTKVNCSDGSANKMCDVTIMRTGTEDSPIGGVKLVFRNQTSGISSPAAISVTGNIEPLVGKKATGIDTKIPNADGVDLVEFTAFFIDSTSDKEMICSQSNYLSFSLSLLYYINFIILSD